ncbi:hypothetical protein SKAU_G00230000 [Synaphobranchus kaupii]|uniref:Methyltransferase domain-containing protein n=1 Tax=Synaphobranchus kaupii TaxID=118154 RepID=A0A9Q1F5U9_SYNKA|nr:hypothetical protein SKAU_G00230000 [Synaphobranchus kaupii]
MTNMITKHIIRMAVYKFMNLSYYPAILADAVTAHLSHPKKSFLGYIVRQCMETNNMFLMRNAARLCQIQPSHNILEVGFGIGAGLQEGTKFVTDPKGKLFGLDQSEYMHRVAQVRLASHLGSGKVHLLLGQVECIPLPDRCIDGVFHSNCHIYWPDKTAAVAELLRVMKPGAKMVATVDMVLLKHGDKKGFFRGMSVEPGPYIEALNALGFVDVHMVDKHDGSQNFLAIFATAPLA